MSDYSTVDLLIEAIDEEPAGPLTSEGVALVRKGWVHGQEVAEAEISTLRQQLNQALAEAESLRGRCGELELVVVHTKEVCAESLKRVVACWREDGVSGEHSNVANAYEDFIGGLPSASAWLLRRQAEALEAEADEWSDDEMTYSGRKVKQELLDEAQRLRGEADDD